MDEVKRPVGRPSVYTSEMSEIATSIMSQGGSKTEVAAEIGIDRTTLYDWCDPKNESYIPEFSNAIKRGQALAEAWWEKMGRTAAFGGIDKFSAPAWIFTMKNRFRENYADDQNINVGGQNGKNPVETVHSVVFVDPPKQIDG